MRAEYLICVSYLAAKVSLFQIPILYQVNRVKLSRGLRPIDDSCIGTSARRHAIRLQRAAHSSYCLRFYILKGTAWTFTCGLGCVRNHKTKVTFNYCDYDSKYLVPPAAWSPKPAFFLIGDGVIHMEYGVV